MRLHKAGSSERTGAPMATFMTHHGPRRARLPWPLRPRTAVIGLGALIALAWVCDTGVHRALSPEWNAWNNDFSRMLRIAGYLPTWIIVGAALALAESARRGAPRAWPVAGGLVASAGLAGGLAELLKVIVRRARPNATDGEHVFVAFSTAWDKGFGMPSSHAAVAFGASFLVSMWWPRAAWAVLPVAVGCGFTRMAAGAHFFSDVAAAALIGYLSAWCVFKVLPRAGGREAGRGGG